MYLAVIGDLIDSKAIPDRKSVQGKIEQVFKKFNKRNKEFLASDLTLTLGDEFQMLLKPTQEIFRLLDELEAALPWPFRIGLGFGPIQTEIRSDISIGADGEAYWHAREAVEDVHDNNWGGTSKIRFKGFSEKQDEIINTLLLTSDLIKQHWTDLQRNTFQAMLTSGIYEPNFDQKALAEKLDISQSSLSKRLSGGSIKIYVRARNVLGQLIEEGAHE